MIIFKILLCFVPWKLRRLLLNKFFHYEIHPTARIGLSYIYPRKLKMEAYSTIGHLNVAIHLNYIEMQENSCISQKIGLQVSLHIQNLNISHTILKEK